MDSGSYAVCTALMGRTDALEVVANNLANTNTAGYRAQHNVFRSLLAQSSNAPSSALNRATNDYGILAGSRLDSAQGRLERTGNDLDFGIEGPGYFVVQTPAGRRFTRNGNFQVSPQGQLITAQGDPVMGDNGVIQIVGTPISVSADGTISTNGAIAGQLKMVEFPPAVSLQSVGNNYYSAPAQSDQAAVNSQVQQGTLEGSNVDPIGSMVELINLQRFAEMAQRALSTFHNDFDKVATEDLPRVNS